MPPGKKIIPKKNNLDLVQENTEETKLIHSADELTNQTEDLTNNIITSSEIINNVENQLNVVEVKQTTPSAKSKAKKKEKLEDAPTIVGGGKTSKKTTTPKTAKPKVKPTSPDENTKKVKSSKKKSVAQKTDNNTDQESDNESNIRSFKVKLPDSDIYKGRFTGLTPYQAANKALSKFFRLNKNILNTEIEFNICESTRKSKKTVYSYLGRRYKLDTPVKYEIKDSDGNMREIVKNFKNSLRKIKKINNTDKSEKSEILEITESVT